MNADAVISQIEQERNELKQKLNFELYSPVGLNSLLNFANEQIAQLTKQLDEEQLNRIGCERAMEELRRCCGLDTSKIDLREVKLHIDCIVKERDELNEQNGDLRLALKQAYEDNWTGSLIDRLNELARENPVEFAEVKNGEEASKLIQEVHGRYNQLKSERDQLTAQVEVLTKDADQLAAKCAEMRTLLKLVWDEEEMGWIIDAYLHRECVKCGGLDGEHSPECIQPKFEHALSDQCGVGWLSPEKKRVLVEALEYLAAECDEPVHANAAKKALEAAR